MVCRPVARGIDAEFSGRSGARVDRDGARGSDAATLLPLPEVRWQTGQSAARTLRTMSEFELLRRLLAARNRVGLDVASA